MSNNALCEDLERRCLLDANTVVASSGLLESYPVIVIAPRPDVPLGIDPISPSTTTTISIAETRVEAGSLFQVSASVAATSGLIASGTVAFVQLGGIGSWLLDPSTATWKSVKVLATAELDETGSTSAIVPTQLPRTSAADLGTGPLAPGEYEIAAVYLGTDPLVVTEAPWSTAALESTLTLTPQSSGTLVWTKNLPYSVDFEYWNHRVYVRTVGARQDGLIFASHPSRQLDSIDVYGPATSLPLLIKATSRNAYGEATEVSIAPASTLPANGNEQSSVSGTVAVKVEATVGLEVSTPAISTPRLMQPIVARFTRPDGSYYRPDEQTLSPVGSSFVRETSLNVEYSNPGGGSGSSGASGVVIESGTMPPLIQYDGVVTFMEGDVVLGTAQMRTSGATVFIIPPSLPVGEHVITAHYSGDGFSDCVSDPITYEVRENSVVGTLNVTDLGGQTLKLVATTQTSYFDSAAPMGNIVFFAGTEELGTLALGVKSNGQVTLEPGEHALWFRYSGDANYPPFESEAQIYTIVASEPEPPISQEPAPPILPPTPTPPILPKPPMAPGPLVVNGTEGDDEITVELKENGEDIVVRVNGLGTQGYFLFGSIYISAGAGNDTICLIGALPSATIYGGDGDDSIVGGPAADVIYAGAGNDTIFAGAGSDTVYGGAGDDVIMGGLRRDSIMAGLGNDIVGGGEGPDTIYGGDGADVLRGGRGGDRLEGRGKADTIYGGAGNDTVHGQAGSDEIHGEDGDDIIDVFEGAGSPFRDRVFGGLGSNHARSDLLDEVRDCELLS